MIIYSITTTNMPRYRGIRDIVTKFAIMPNIEGITIDPRYADAIWIPIMAWELSSPKWSGVEWMMQG